MPAKITTKSDLCQVRLPCYSLWTMEKQPRALMAYMTGTGNTAHAASAIAQELAREGWTVRLAELGREAAPALEEADLLVLGFPVLGFGMPGLVRGKLKGMRGCGRPAAVFATWGGEGTIALWQACWFLRRKGFRAVAASGATYPFQWTHVTPPPAEKTASGMIEGGEEQARRFGQMLAADLGGEGARQPARMLARMPGTPLRRAAAFLLTFPFPALYSWIGRSGLAAMYAADERCRACGNCARDCPAEAIVLSGTGAARRPRWRASCQGCNRCINLCPRRAVQVSPVRAAVHLLFNSAVIAGIVIGLNRVAGAAVEAAAAAALSVPGPIMVCGYIAALIALVVLGSRLQFAGLERPLFALESIPTVRRTIAHSWTARFPRYRCPGFQPARDERPPLS